MINWHYVHFTCDMVVHLNFHCRSCDRVRNAPPEGRSIEAARRLHEESRHLEKRTGHIERPT